MKMEEFCFLDMAKPKQRSDKSYLRAGTLILLWIVMIGSSLHIWGVSFNHKHLVTNGNEMCNKVKDNMVSDGITRSKRSSGLFNENDKTIISNSVVKTTSTTVQPKKIVYKYTNELFENTTPQIKTSSNANNNNKINQKQRTTKGTLQTKSHSIHNDNKKSQNIRKSNSVSQNEITTEVFQKTTDHINIQKQGNVGSYSIHIDNKTFQNITKSNLASQNEITTEVFQGTNDVNFQKQITSTTLKPSNRQINDQIARYQPNNKDKSSGGETKQATKNNTLGVNISTQTKNDISNVSNKTQSSTGQLINLHTRIMNESKANVSSETQTVIGQVNSLDKSIVNNTKTDVSSEIRNATGQMKSQDNKTKADVSNEAQNATDQVNSKDKIVVNKIIQTDYVPIQIHNGVKNGTKGGVNSQKQITSTTLKPSNRQKNAQNTRYQPNNNKSSGSKIKQATKNNTLGVNISTQAKKDISNVHNIQSVTDQANNLSNSTVNEPRQTNVSNKTQSSTGQLINLHTSIMNESKANFSSETQTVMSVTDQANNLSNSTVNEPRQTKVSNETHSSTGQLINLHTSIMNESKANFSSETQTVIGQVNSLDKSNMNKNAYLDTIQNATTGQVNSPDKSIVNNTKTDVSSEIQNATGQMKSQDNKTKADVSNEAQNATDQVNSKDKIVEDKIIQTDYVPIQIHNGVKNGTKGGVNSQKQITSTTLKPSNRQKNAQNTRYQPNNNKSSGSKIKQATKNNTLGVNISTQAKKDISNVHNIQSVTDQANNLSNSTVNEPRQTNVSNKTQSSTGQLINLNTSIMNESKANVSSETQTVIGQVNSLDKSNVNKNAYLNIIQNATVGQVNSTDKSIVYNTKTDVSDKLQDATAQVNSEDMGTVNKTKTVVPNQIYSGISEVNNSNKSMTKESVQAIENSISTTKKVPWWVENSTENAANKIPNTTNISAVKTAPSGVEIIYNATDQVNNINKSGVNKSDIEDTVINCSDDKWNDTVQNGTRPILKYCVHYCYLGWDILGFISSVLGIYGIHKNISKFLMFSTLFFYFSTIIQILIALEVNIDPSTEFRKFILFESTGVYWKDFENTTILINIVLLIFIATLLCFAIIVNMYRRTMMKNSNDEIFDLDARIPLKYATPSYWPDMYSISR